MAKSSKYVPLSKRGLKKDNSIHPEFGWGGGFKGALSGGVNGALMGSSFGPIGSAIGGGLGLLTGAFQGSSQEDESIKMQQEQAKQMQQQQFQISQNGIQASYMAQGGMQRYKLANGGQANAEVENNEVMRDPQGNTEQFKGATHEQGGISADLTPGTQIFSERLKSASGKSFAEEAKKYDTSKVKKIMEDDKTDALKKKTAELLFKRNNQTLTTLFQEQESQKNENFNSDLFAFGGVMKYKDGGIHIKPENKGKFTTAAKRAGMGVQEYASKVLAHKEHYSSTLVKRANFAHNASKFKHATGGTIDANKLPSYFENGGTKQAFLDRAMDTRINTAYFANGGPYENQPEPQMGFDTSNYQAPGNTLSTLQGKIDDSDAGTNPNTWWNRNKGTIGNISKEVGIGAISNAGNLAYLGEQGKKYDRQQFYGYNPQQLDVTNALRDIDQSTGALRRTIPGQSSGSGSLAINGLLANKLQGDTTKSDIRERYDNANAGIMNQGQQFNIGNRYRTDDINAANKGQALTNYYSALGQMGRNTGQQLRDNQVYQDQKSSDNMRMSTLNDLYSNFQYDNKSGHWIPKNK